MSVQFERFPQLRDGQMEGVVTLNCCSTPLISRIHSLHWKVPTRSSGFTSVVRVTVPHIVTSCPNLSVFKFQLAGFANLFNLFLKLYIVYACQKLGNSCIQ